MNGGIVETKCNYCRSLIHVPCGHATLIGGDDEWYLTFDCTVCGGTNIKELFSSAFIVWLADSGAKYKSWKDFRDSVDAPIDSEEVERAVRTIELSDEFDYSVRTELGIE